VYGDGQQQRCFANVSDVVDAIQRLSMTDSALGQVLNIGSDEEISMLQLAEQVRDQADSASEIKLIPYEEAYSTPGFEDFRRRVPGLAKIKSTIDWSPRTPLTQTIDQIIAYYRDKMYSG
jgi:UDP-glucose 4-epimerase